MAGRKALRNGSIALDCPMRRDDVFVAISIMADDKFATDACLKDEKAILGFPHNITRTKEAF